MPKFKITIDDEIFEVKAYDAMEAAREAAKSYDMQDGDYPIANSDYPYISLVRDEFGNVGKFDIYGEIDPTYSVAPHKDKREP